MFEAPPILAPGKVTVSPAACPVPPLIIVTVGVDEPSVVTLTWAPVPEPVVADWVTS